MRIILQNQFAVHDKIFSHITMLVKILFYNPLAIKKDANKEFLKFILSSDQKNYQRLGLFCINSISLNQIDPEDFLCLNALPLIISNLDSQIQKQRL